MTPGYSTGRRRTANCEEGAFSAIVVNYTERRGSPPHVLTHISGKPTRSSMWTIAIGSPHYRPRLALTPAFFVCYGTPTNGHLGVRIDCRHIVRPLLRESRLEAGTQTVLPSALGLSLFEALESDEQGG
jgi:hypothetical protein